MVSKSNLTVTEKKDITAMSEKESATTSKPPSTESRHEPEVILTYPSERKVGKKINRDSQSVGPQISPDDFNYS